MDRKNLFLLSFSNRDSLATEISAFGWQVSSARRGDDLVSRFLASNALIAVVDLRGSHSGGLKAIYKLSELAKNSGIAIVALADSSVEADAAEQCYDAGATHFLEMSNDLADIQQTLNFAYRFVEQMRGGSEFTKEFSALLAENVEEWHFEKANFNSMWISSMLREKLPALDFNIYPVTALYRDLDVEERQRVRGAMRRLKTGANQAAVLHQIDGKDVIHHLYDVDGKIHGRIERREPAGGTGDWTSRDILSGLKNGSAARVWIREHLQKSHKIGLITLGIKNFSIFNAAYGRNIGDQILRIVGQRLLVETAKQSPERCLVARMDGQNFLIAAVMDNSNREFVDYGKHLLEKIFYPAFVGRRTIQLIARAGIAVSDGAGDETLLIRRASLALVDAMSSDAIPLKVSVSSEKDLLLEQLLERDLIEAIEQDQIAIALQPQIRLDTGQLVGAEALARWDHPKSGFLGAATLFSAAERAGLMEPLSAHIRALALKTAASWPESLSFLRISINITAGDLANRRFVENIGNDIAKYGFPAERVTLELTESELVSDVSGAARQLSELRDIGVRIAIDDFGTGYSSLAYLKDLPLDYLKLDSGLTGDISGTGKDQVVVKSIVKMARSLGLSVVAEGVETEEQLKTLAEQGCELFQGFLRSGPLLPDEFEIFALRSN